MEENKKSYYVKIRNLIGYGYGPKWANSTIYCQKFEPTFGPLQGFSTFLSFCFTWLTSSVLKVFFILMFFSFDVKI